MTPGCINTGILIAKRRQPGPLKVLTENSKSSCVIVAEATIMEKTSGLKKKKRKKARKTRSHGVFKVLEIDLMEIIVKSHSTAEMCSEENDNKRFRNWVWCSVFMCVKMHFRPCAHTACTYGGQ